MKPKDKRMQYLASVIDHYTKTEPKLTLQDIAIVVAMELGEELIPFLNKLKREIKK
jgi:hypothetical protein